MGKTLIRIVAIALDNKASVVQKAVTAIDATAVAASVGAAMMTLTAKGLLKIAK